MDCLNRRESRAHAYRSNRGHCMGMVMVLNKIVGILLMVHSGHVLCMSVLQSDGVNHNNTVCRSDKPCDAGGQCCLEYFHGICFYGDARMPETCIEDLTGRCARSSDCPAGRVCEGAWSNKWGVCERHPCHVGRSLCGGRGECVPAGDSYTCACDPDYTGRRCAVSVTHPCAEGPCGDFGECLPDGDSYTCNCTSPDWTGPWCSIKGPCVDNPCMHGGTCVPGAHGAFTCACTDDYNGPTCGTPHPCDQDPDPCQNQATCLKEGPGYRCLCESGFWGQNCTTNCNFDYGKRESDYPAVIQFPPEGMEEYPPDVFCRFRARTRNNARAKLRLVFERFDLETHPTCGYDKLVVRDGATEIADSPFCGSSLPPVFTTSGGVLIMRLKTDRAGGGRGFKATVYWVN